jgi:hypothetical protein
LKNWTAGEPDEVGNMENEVGRGIKRGNKTVAKTKRMNVDKFLQMLWCLSFGSWD